MAPMQVLRLEPAQTLHFCQASSESSQCASLNLNNTSSKHVAFKVKATAPNSCKVRPSSGTLKPGNSQLVQITLRSDDADGAAIASSRFLVQAVEVDGPDNVSREAWDGFNKKDMRFQHLGVKLQDHQLLEDGEDEKNNGMLGFAASKAPSDWKAKYDELVQSTLKLEVENKKLKADMKKLHSKTQRNFIIAALSVVILSYLVRSIG
mmetsp:Transcript_139181/g.259549  ORF Transcript_139181/g.259549 Transcript_139181/m.259549 type:complete len:207 (+) Transcript_139181:94-714(+)